jgi:hypothetical protein
MLKLADDEPQFLGSILDADGFGAGVAGIDAGRNPDRAGTWAHGLWLNGWRDGDASRAAK